ncbi:uncharacterized protein FSUBG_6123 [Fusarium subglutinans]|uniref:Uncharacterized protein n=1 Tax=Gibberella subglutinans TaxID=42677 RepID=A0A8H5V2E6_GIBSU|nr:uncharacterized protein FSUBG_6123 [Fusarium subglutinans]KAF5606290.1 hypothetical protein FSUBG_6123 [Fusarium subglutinans]
MPPKRRGSGRKRQRSPTASPSPRPTRAARISNDDRVASPVLSADEPQDSPAGTGEECVYAQDDGLHRLLEKVKQEAVAQYKRIDAERTPDEEPTEDKVPGG